MIEFLKKTNNFPISEGNHSDCYIPLNTSVQLDSLVVLQLCLVVKCLQ